MSIDGTCDPMDRAVGFADSKFRPKRKIRSESVREPIPEVYVPERDEEGNRVDERFRTAAKDNSTRFYSYRRGQLRDPAKIALLVDRAAFEASARACIETIKNPFGLIWAIFRKLVSHEIEREQRIATADAPYLEQQAGAARHGSASQIENRILTREVLEDADQRFRDICILKKQGHSTREIARILGIETSHVSTIFHRGKKKIIENNSLPPADR